MKRILSILLLIFCANANAVVDHYAWGAIAFPDETSTNGLPEAIPCITKKAFNGQPMLKCTWLETARDVLIWDAQRQQNVRYVNQVSGQCLRGKCRISNAMMGEWNQDVLFTLSIWYRIGTSTDGKPVAYRIDTSRQVSYAEAGSILYQFYLDIGVPDEQLVTTLDGRYEGGYAAWQAQKGVPKLRCYSHLPPRPNPNGQKSKPPGAIRVWMMIAISTTRKYLLPNWANGCRTLANRMPTS